MTPKGQAARALALIKKTRNKAKNVAKNSGRAAKRIIRTVDDVFAMNPNLVSMAGLNQAAAVVSSVRKVVAPKVSPCIKKWFTCLTTPFHQGAMGACIPSGDTHSSQRRFGFIRTEFVIGTMGVGFVALSPSLANDAPQMYVTTALFTGNSMTILASNNVYATGIKSIGAANLPYSSGEFFTPNTTETSVQGRIVGGGVRVQYIGKTVDQAGLSYFYTDPQHITAVNSIQGTATTMSAAELGAYQETIIKPVSREPVENVLAPMTQLELEYYTPVYRSTVDTSKEVYPWGESQNFNSGFTTNASAGGAGNLAMNCAAPISVFFVSGATPGSTFHIEYGIHTEYVGRASEGQRLPADSDPVGVGHMMAAISRATISEGASKTTNFPSRLREAYAEVTRNAASSTRL